MESRRLVLTGLSLLLLLSVLTAPFGPWGSLAALALWSLGRALTPLESRSKRPTPGASPRALWLLGACVLAGLWLRWPIASHDLEHYIGPDEGEVVENVLEMIKTGDFDPRHPGYPGLHFYIQRVPAAMHLAMTGKSVPELPREDFYLLARRLTLIAGLLAAAVTYGVGRLWLSSWGAVLGAALVAVSPLAFRESAVVNPDLMLMLFVAVSLGLSLRLLEDRSRRAFLLAGASAGLAAAVKYTGAFAVAPFLTAFLLGAAPRKHVLRALTGLAAAGMAFVIASPYTVLSLAAFLRGLSMHVSYYRAADANAPLALSTQVASRGLGWPGALVAVGAAFEALRRWDVRLLVVAAYPAGYLFVFSFFDRAFPRHALPLLPAAALLAATGVERIARRWPWPGVVLGVALLIPPLWGSASVLSRALRPSPADEAALWVETRIPPGARVLADQFTPRLDPERYRVHRLRVEERVFVGNFDWVLRSGYPPGIVTRGLREVTRFENRDALGDAIVLYEVPERESLMPSSFRGGARELVIGAGELPYFGEGWYRPAAGAFETSRLSRGAFSEIYWLLPQDVAAGGLTAELVLGTVPSGTESRVTLSMNGERLGGVLVDAERGAYPSAFPPRALREGLNRLVLRYDGTRRLDRRHRDTAVRFFRLRLRRKAGS